MESSSCSEGKANAKDIQLFQQETCAYATNNSTRNANDASNRGLPTHFSTGGPLSQEDFHIITRCLLDESKASRYGVDGRRTPTFLELSSTGPTPPMNTPNEFASCSGSNTTTDITPRASSPAGTASREISRHSLPETISTEPEAETTSPRPVKRDGTKDGENQPHKVATSEVDLKAPLSRSASVPSGLNFFSKAAQKTEKWTHNLLHDINTPYRRYQVRKEKKPAPKPPSAPPPPPPPRKKVPKYPEPYLERCFAPPSTSTEFDGLGLQGGKGPPRELSLKELTELDTIYEKILRKKFALNKLRWELDELDERKAELLEKMWHVEEAAKGEKGGKEQEKKHPGPLSIKKGLYSAFR